MAAKRPAPFHSHPLDTIYYAKHGDQHCSRHGAVGRGARARSCFCEASNSEKGGGLRCASRLPDTHTIANYIAYSSKPNPGKAQLQEHKAAA